MKHVKTAALLAALFLAAGFFAACRVQKETEKIGYISSSFNDTLQVSIMDAFKSYITENTKYELVLHDAQEDVMWQQDLTNTLISEGVKALIVVPVNTGAMLPITDAAGTAGIPLVYVNRNPFEKGYLPANVYYIGPMDLAGGQAQMEIMGKLLQGRGNAAILMGKLDSDGAILRTLGNEIAARQKFPDIKILAKESGNWQRDEAMGITARWLSAYGNNLNGILSNNDEMALGAIETLHTAGRTDVIVIGLDAIPAAKAAVAEGSMAATLMQDTARQGRGAAETACKAIRGELARQVTWIPFILVTGDTVK
jgi:inositol transport system substrate-binding protein